MYISNIYILKSWSLILFITKYWNIHLSKAFVPLTLNQMWPAFLINFK